MPFALHDRTCPPAGPDERHAGRPARLRPVVSTLSLAMSGVGLYAGVAGAACAQAIQAHADQALAIQAGPLAPALRSFASAAGILLTYTDDQVRGKVTPGLARVSSVERALDGLLAGTGLQAVRLDNGAYVLRDAPAASAARTGHPVQDYAPLPVVTVTGTAEPANVLLAGIGAARMAGPVQDLPQTVDVVTRDVLEQQQAATLEQALHNVPSITVAIGEANAGPNGDQFRLRGLEADTYLDGLHDFGVYVRDTFDTERIEVLKGPSSDNFGMGTSGGAINSESKLANLRDAAGIDGQLGSGPLRRVTVDVNRRIGASSALRVNLMRHEQDVVGRDGVVSDRWGAAISFAPTLGGDASWYMNYLHQSNDRTPDYGQPLMAATVDGVRRPAAEFGVPAGFYYGKDTDRDRSDADILTSLYRRRLGGTAVIANETRLARHERYFSTTAPSCFGSDGTCGPTGALSYFAGGDPAVVIGNGGPSYAQRVRGMQSVTTLRATFASGRLRHEVVAGVDLLYRDDDILYYAYRTPDGLAAARKIPGTLWHPDTSSANYIVAVNPAATNNMRRSRQRGAALFASDRVQLAPAWLVRAALRYDAWRQDFRLAGSADPAGTTARVAPHFASPKLSLAWEPDTDRTVYLSSGRASAFPYGGNVSADASQAGVNAITRQAEPETTRSIELGTKLHLLQKKLGVSAALFRIRKDNAHYDDGMGNLVDSGYRQQMAGLEFGLTGRLARRWSILAAYTFVDSKILDAPAANRWQVGNPVQGAARNAASLWTTLDLGAAAGLPGRFALGGGLAYRDRMSIRNDLLAEVPHAFSIDAMASYDYKGLKFMITGRNLGNRINYDNVFAGKTAYAARAVPSSGRSVVLGASAAF